MARTDEEHSFLSVAFPHSAKYRIPWEWFHVPGIFRGRHRVDGGKTVGLADCRVLLRNTSATLYYPATARNGRLGAEHGRLVLTFADASRRSILKAHWWPHAEAQSEARRHKRTVLPTAEVPPPLHPARGNDLFVGNPSELAASVSVFAATDALTQREVMRNRPKYFVHTQSGKSARFGLSKFVVFNGISVDDYCEEMWTETSGGPAQKHIRRMTGLQWTPLAKLPAQVRKDFVAWMLGRGFKLPLSKELRVLSLGDQASIRAPIASGHRGGRRGRPLSPEALAEKLEAQARLGRAGEAVALAFERARLKAGADSNQVRHVAKHNVSAGYDIESDGPSGTRFIEVKASRIRGGRFFLTQNEMSVLESLGSRAFLYLVQVTKDKPPAGRVVKVMSDPVTKLRETGLLEAVAYQVRPPKGFIKPCGKKGRKRV